MLLTNAFLSYFLFDKSKIFLILFYKLFNNFMRLFKKNIIKFFWSISGVAMWCNRIYQDGYTFNVAMRKLLTTLIPE